MKEKFYKIKNNFFLTLVKILRYLKVYLILFGIVFLITFITGIMTCVNYLNVVSYENLINKYLMNYLSKESTYLTFFLMMSLWFVVVSLLSYLLTKGYFFIVVNFLVLAIMGYIWGFDICIIVMTLGLAGVVFGVLILGVLGFLLFFVIVLILSLVSKKFTTYKNFCDNESRKNYFKLLILFLIIGILIIFIISILFGIIHIFVIVD